ncbi:acyl-CoA dehydrogenase family protein [Rhodococcus wratislaviensis]|uniref:Putative acyl-CoA dehydrogenase n=1 Tax=Rhodococcus wratislaviensis NBRC 100605 TaxID=1219028 RepID=X0PM78_RHOWR|nr:acyl-CoA dehydrogenase family protein [Rhodococcus wratislaviensis]GAF43639.1 putative acyl-CoA dehydrogenase [Rhodococcus wratislaviensis NBRC 100605]
MYLELTDDLLDYRNRIREHIAAHRPPMNRLPGTRSPKPADLPVYRQWCASLFSAGFVGADWPEEWGGRADHTALQDFVLDVELAQAKTPRPIGAYNLISGALLASGTQEQKAKFLPRIRQFDDLWCQLFSEPDAGSDLASLRTKARREGDDWVVSGQKVWTTHAHIADFGFLLARTDPAVRKHAGITAFVVDMQTPGITVRPLREITGSSDFNEVFFDEVRIPRENMIGAAGEGWAIARSALAHERSQSQREDSIADAVRQLVQIAADSPRDGRPASEYSEVRQRIGSFFARAQVSDLLGFKGLLKSADGVSDVGDSPVSKVVFTEANLDIATYALELQGNRGVLDSPDEEVLDGGRWQEAFLYARGFTISAGSNEIMRNLIAERALRLPRDPAAG